MPTDNRESTPVTEEIETGLSVRHWLSHHKTYVALALLVVLLVVAIAWMFPQRPYGIDTTPCETFGLSPEEKRDYWPPRIVPLRGTPYIYCEFDRGGRVWSSVDSDYDVDTIGILVDTQSGKRLLRLSWHNAQRFRYIYVVRNLASGYPVLASNDRPGLLLSSTRDRWDGILHSIGLNFHNKEYLFIDLKGKVEGVTDADKEFPGWNATSPVMNDMPFLDGPVYKQLMERDNRRVFACVHTREGRQFRFYGDDTLLFYLDGTLRTVKPNGTNEKQIFPHPTPKKESPLAQ